MLLEEKKIFSPELHMVKELSAAVVALLRTKEMEPNLGIRGLCFYFIIIF